MEEIQSGYKRLERWADPSATILIGKTDTELTELFIKLEKDKQTFFKKWMDVFNMDHDEDTITELEALKEKAFAAVEKAAERISNYKASQGQIVDDGPSTSYQEGNPVESRPPTTPANSERSSLVPTIIPRALSEPMLGAPTTRHQQRVRDKAESEAHKTEGVGKSGEMGKIESEIPQNSYNAPSGDEIQNSQYENLHTLYHPRLDLKFDRVTLPTFDGNLMDWIPFRDQFTDMVHTNRNLSMLMKFHLLRSHLRGAALETVNGYKFMSVNYLPAWEDLVRRYNREDDIIEEYIRKFMELPILSNHPTSESFIQILNATNQMLRALPNWGIKVNSWDPWIKFMILAKIDEHSRRAWLTEKKRRQQVPLQELLEFLELRASEAQHSQSDAFRQLFSNYAKKKSEPKRKLNSHLVYSEKCSHCQGEHRVYQCPKFLEQDAKARSNTIRGLKLCYKCLGTHGDNKCKLGNCKRCDKPHNTLLCFKSTKPKEETKSNEQQQ